MIIFTIESKTQRLKKEIEKRQKALILKAHQTAQAGLGFLKVNQVATDIMSKEYGKLITEVKTLESLSINMNHTNYKWIKTYLHKVK